MLGYVVQRQCIASDTVWQQVKLETLSCVLTTSTFHARFCRRRPIAQSVKSTASVRSIEASMTLTGICGQPTDISDCVVSMCDLPLLENAETRFTVAKSLGIMTAFSLGISMIQHGALQAIDSYGLSSRTSAISSMP